MSSAGQAGPRQSVRSRCEMLRHSLSGRRNKTQCEDGEEGAVGVVEDISEHGGKSKGLEIRNGSTNLRKRKSELAQEWERGSSSKSPRAAEPRRQPPGAGGGSKSSRRRMPGKKSRK